MNANALEMSDEEFEKLAPSQLVQEEESASEETTEEVVEDGLQEQQEEETDEVEEEEEPEANSEPSDETSEESDTDTEEEGDVSSEEPTEASETNSVNYEEEYNKLLAPFKANGKEMRVNSIDDARTLMQMGANYNKKMAALKPNLRIVKMLEKNGLLEEDKLNFLIDLQNKNPEAISKFIKDSGIDPLDLDTSKADTYKPKAYTVSDKEVELDGILAEIQDTKSFDTTIDIISNKWDDSSKKVLYENPEIIKFINEHVSTGVYDQISSIVERERMLGRLVGVSDIDAYKAVGDVLFGNESNQPISRTTNQSVKRVPKSDAAIKDRKKAASTTKSVKKTHSDNDFNPLAMSDEEFEKIANSKFI